MNSTPRSSARRGVAHRPLRHSRRHLHRVARRGLQRFARPRRPLRNIKEVYCDTASLSSLNLLKVLLAERGMKPEFKPLPDTQKAAEHDAVLLIGDPAIDFQRAPHEHEIFDLGSAWLELTNLPFVFAVWALRRGIENSELARQLLDAKDFGVDTLDYLIETREEYDEDFRRDYLGWHVHYHLARTRNAASRNSPNCSGSTDSARCLSRNMFRRRPR